MSGAFGGHFIERQEGDEPNSTTGEGSEGGRGPGAVVLTRPVTDSGERALLSGLVAAYA